jgi:O-acetyl-ADP-ribose deacetylase (regulator of RNase III)
MSITYSSGDLVDADVDALVNTVNTVGVMGKGLALQFKRRFPDNFRRYAAACKRDEVQLGHMFVVSVDALDGPRYIVNFPTKKHWRSRSRLPDIEEGLHDLVRVVQELGITSIAVPPLGTGNGGLKWPEVNQVLERYLDKLNNVDVRVFPPTEKARSLAPKPVAMTWSRSLVVELIRGYGPRRFDPDVDAPPVSASHLEIQKLLYFATPAMPGTDLQFAPGWYGPYSEFARHVLQEMEGSYLEGLGDGTGTVQELAPISPTAAGAQASAYYIAESGKDIRGELVEPTLALVDGFEGPYELELLASTHWAASQAGAQTAEEAARVVRSWTSRKGRLFTDDHVDVAWRHLAAKGLIPAAMSASG